MQVLIGQVTITFSGFPHFFFPRWCTMKKYQYLPLLQFVGRSKKSISSFRSLFMFMLDLWWILLLLDIKSLQCLTWAYFWKIVYQLGELLYTAYPSLDFFAKHRASVLFKPPLRLLGIGQCISLWQIFVYRWSQEVPVQPYFCAEQRISTNDNILLK